MGNSATIAFKKTKGVHHELATLERSRARRSHVLRCARSRHRAAHARSRRRLRGTPRIAARQAADGRTLHLLRPFRAGAVRLRQGMDVRPHPHIGLATVTYLFDGAIMHRDSEGNIQEIQPGAMNLMTAGRGIAHSERTPDVQRASGQKMLGLQSWIALPAGSEEIAPSFQHYAAEALPTVKESGFTARIIAGSGFGVTSPVSMVSPWFYTEVTAQAGTSVPLDPDHEERAI